MALNIYMLGKAEFHLVLVKLVIMLFMAGCYRRSSAKGSLPLIFYFISAGLLFTLSKDVKSGEILLTCGRNHLPALTPHRKRPIRIISKDWAILLQPMIDADVIMSTLVYRRHFFL